MDHNHSLSSYGDSYGVLELCLRNILSLIKPSENDQLKRLCTIDEIAILARSVDSLKDAVIRPFGSFISNLYTKWGDLDTSVELSHSSPSSTGRKRKQNALRDIMKVLQKNGVARKFTYIPNARVPVLKFESSRHNVSCDVSIDNHMGWMKSRILLWISEIDERFRDMVLLAKEWAKTHNINDPTLGTLNSYSLCLLVIFHFQTCTPAILPPLKDIYDGNFVGITGSWSSIERQMEDACAANIARFKFSRQRNPIPLCQLLISFFGKFSKIESLSSEYAICTYTGQWERITSNPRWMEKSHHLLVEDPFDRPDNAARAVRSRELSIISEAFMTTSQKLPSYSLVSDRNSLLDILLRPNISLQLKVGTSQSHYAKHNSHEKLQSHYAKHGSRENLQIAFSGSAKKADKQTQSSNSTILSCENLQTALSSLAELVDKHSRSSNSTITNCENPQVAFSSSTKTVDKQCKSSNSTRCVNSQIAFSSLRVDKQSQFSTSPISSRKKPQIAFSGSAKRVANNMSQSANSTVASCENPQNGFSGSAKRVDKQSRSSNSTNCVNPQIAFSGLRVDKQTQSSSSPIASRKKPQTASSGSAKRMANNMSPSANTAVASCENPEIAFFGSANRVDTQNRLSNSTIATCENPPIARSGGTRRVYKSNRKSQSPNSTVAQPGHGSISVQGQQVWRPKNLNR